MSVLLDNTKKIRRSDSPMSVVFRSYEKNTNRRVRVHPEAGKRQNKRHLIVMLDYKQVGNKAANMGC